MISSSLIYVDVVSLVCVCVCVCSDGLFCLATQTTWDSIPTPRMVYPSEGHSFTKIVELRVVLSFVAQKPPPVYRKSAERKLFLRVFLLWNVCCCWCYSIQNRECFCAFIPAG